MIVVTWAKWDGQDGCQVRDPCLRPHCFRWQVLKNFQWPHWMCSRLVCDRSKDISDQYTMRFGLKTYSNQSMRSFQVSLVLKNCQCQHLIWGKGSSVCRHLINDSVRRATTLAMSTQMMNVLWWILNNDRSESPTLSSLHTQVLWNISYNIKTHKSALCLD